MDVVFQGRDSFVKPELFGVIGADGTLACDSEVFALWVGEAVFGVRDFFKLSYFVGGGISCAP